MSDSDSDQSEDNSALNAQKNYKKNTKSLKMAKKLRNYCAKQASDDDRFLQSLNPETLRYPTPIARVKQGVVTVGSIISEEEVWNGGTGDTGDGVVKAWKVSFKNQEQVMNWEAVRLVLRKYILVSAYIEQYGYKAKSLIQ
jgi:hypothetical protein